MEIDTNFVCMEAYKRWVRTNKEYVHSLESLFNGLTWLLPERFSESEIGPEAVTSVLGIITAINEHIIDTAPTQLHEQSSSPSSFPYSLCITLLKDSETFIEVVGQQYYGEDKKWNFIAVTEAIKALVRLALLRNHGYKMLLHGGENPNEGNESDALKLQSGYGNRTQNRQHLGQTHLEGRALSALSRFGENARRVSEPAWLRRVQHQQAIMEPTAAVVKRPTLSSILSEKGLPGGFFVLGEATYILRPLIYVLLIRKYGVRSWFPWSVSLAVDLMGMSILSLVTTSWRTKQNNSIHLSNPEKNELNRRKILWALYLMRDPFFCNYTRQRLESTERILQPIPVIGFLAAKLIELMVGAQTRYTYMSGS